MKRCASCSKDLPEAALHCVFCGAKQVPSQAVQPGLAKTAFGYSASELEQQRSGQAPGAPYPPQRSGSSNPPPLGQPYPPPVQGGPPPGYPPASLAATAPAHAVTAFAPVGSAPAPPQQPFHAGAMAPLGGMLPPGPSTGMPPQGGMGIHSPQQITPAPLPSVAPPYLASQTAAHGSRPIEPWRDSLRLVMFVWGVVLLAAFATPLATSPIAFHWDAILHGEGTAKLLPLILAAVGLLAVVVGAIPMPSLPRGVLAAILGLAGMVVPIVLAGMPSWQMLLGLVGVLLLVPGLLVRNEYCESVFARVLVTLGVVCALAPLLVPVGGSIPLVALFKALIDLPGEAKLAPSIALGTVVIIVTSLLVWMPGPATGGAKVFAWLIILWTTVVQQFAALVVAGHIPDAIKSKPFVAVMAWAPEATYLVLIGYGLATVFGKQLE